MKADSNPAPNPAVDKTDLLLALGTGLLSLVAYLVCLCPTIGPGDSGELTLVALRLGIAHPPGYPLFTWTGRLATLLPFAEPAIATNLFTARTAAAAVVLLYLAARSLPVSRTGSVAAALCFGLSLTHWTNATSHEVYAFTMLLMALTAFLALQARQNRPRLVLVAAYAFGLAAGHQPTALLWLPGLAVILLSGRTRFSPLWLPALLLFLLGLSTGLGSLLRAVAGPEINWGNPNTIGRLWSHMAGVQYHDLALSVPSALFRQRLVGLPANWAIELGIPAALLAVGGVVRLARRSRSVLLGLLLLVATAAFGLSYAVPDFKPHLLPSLLALALLAGIGTDWVSTAFRKYRRHAAIALLIIVPGFVLLLNLPKNMENRTTIVKDLGVNILGSLPDRATFIYGSDVSGNSVGYRQAIKQTRSDVTLVSAEMLFSTAYWEELEHRIPLPDHRTALLSAGTGPRTERKQILLGIVVERLIARGPVYLAIELLTPDFFGGPVARMSQVIPEGIVNRLAPLNDSLRKDEILGRNHDLWESYQSRLGSLERRYRSPAYQNIQLTYAGSRNNLGMFCLQQGWQEETVANLDAALALPAPDEFKAVVRRNRARALHR